MRQLRASPWICLESKRYAWILIHSQKCIDWDSSNSITFSPEWTNIRCVIQDTWNLFSMNLDIFIGMDTLWNHCLQRIFKNILFHLRCLIAILNNSGMVSRYILNIYKKIFQYQILSVMDANYWCWYFFLFRILLR